MRALDLAGVKVLDVPAYCLLPTAFRPPEPPGTWSVTPWKQPPAVSRRVQIIYYPLRPVRLSLKGL